MRTSAAVGAVSGELRDILQGLLFGFGMLGPAIDHTARTGEVSLFLAFEAAAENGGKKRASLHRKYALENGCTKKSDHTCK